jgi:Zn ribbon nucleic-acid-binding protein
MKQFTQNQKNARAFDVGWGKMTKRIFTMMFLLFFATSALFASHFRYGLLTATRLSETSTTVTYRLNSSQSWRLGEADPSYPFVISGGNSGSFSMPHTIATDPSGGWDNTSGSFVVTLNKTATPTSIAYASFAKISTLQNNAAAAWDQYIILNTNAPGSSPVSTLPAIINLPINVAAATFSIPASDPDAGTTLTYGFPNLVSGQLAGQTQPSGFTLNNVTGQGTLNTVGKSIGQLYNAMVTVSDNNGNQIFLDFIIRIVGSSTPPVFVYPPTPANNAVFNVGPGQNLTFPLQATDADAGSTVSLSVSGLSGTISAANFSPALPATGNPSSTTFSWTPTAPELGSTYVLNFIATDNVGVQSTTSVTINVINAFQCSYTSNGTLTVPPGVTSGTYRLWGAGGGSGVTAGSAASGGGGGGGFVQFNRINLIPGSTFPVTVGAGGTPGNNGGATQIDGASASGGLHGTSTGNGGFGGSQTSPFNVVPAGANFPSGFSFKGGDGGAASSPFELGGGGGGASASATANGNNGTTSSTSSPNGGAGGATNGGNGGNQGSNGNNGTAIGGGGGGRGAGGSTVGGSGAGGQFDVTWNCGTLTSISYPSPTVCSYSTPLMATIVPATSTGGTFSSPTLGAFLNSTTGAIAPGAPQGTHVITYGWAAFCTCPAQSVTFSLVIAPQAVALGLSYTTPLCNNASPVSPTWGTLSGVAGVYTIAPAAGLPINASTGVITPNGATPGSYTVTYTVAASGNCNAVIATSNAIVITALPTIANFDYPGDNTYCAGEGVQTPTSTVFNPNNNVISYSYTTSPGLTLNTSTGAINPATSTPGVYIVTMTIAAGGGCAAVTATSTVEILARPTIVFNYAGNPYCQTIPTSTATADTTTVSSTGGPFTGGNFTATPAGLIINPTTGTITLNSAVGVYTVKLRFIGANGCLDSSSTSVTIKSRPTSTISYTGPNPICSNVSPVVGGNVTAVGAWTLTLSNGQMTTGTGNGPWSITINTLNPGDGPVVFTVTSLIDANNCPAAAIDRPGSVTITKRTITSGTIPSAANTRVCEGQDASINVVLTSSANCAPAPRFSGVFAIEYFDGSGWQPHPTNPTFAWTSNAGASTIGTATAISIPAGILTNPNSYTLQYRISWVSLVDCNGCAADPLTGNVIVEIVPNPLLIVTAAPTGDVCPGTVVPFTTTQAANSYVLPQFALYNWIATATPLVGAPFTIGQGQNVSLGSINVTTPSCPFNGTVTVRFTPLNTSCCNCLYTPIVRTFTVRDILAPTWTTAVGNLNRTVECSDAAALAAAQALFPVATDNCDNNVTNVVKVMGAFVASQTCPQAGTRTNTWTVTDDCGNVSAVYTQVITTVDTQAPTWTTASTALNQTLQCSNTAGIAAAQALFPVASDNCDANVTNLVKVSGAFVASATCPQAGTYTNTWTVTDDCGNVSAVFTQVITIIDTQAPTWVTASTALNQTLQCSNTAGIAAAQALFPVAVDNCDASVTNLVKVSGAFVAGATCPQAGTYTNTWTVADDCGNVSAVFTQVITIIDTQAPTWVTASTALNQTLQCSNTAGIAAAQALFPVAIDNCDASVTNLVKVSGTFVAGATCPQAGTYTNTWTVADDCGNVSAVFTQVITIIDTQAPTWTTATGSLNRTVQCSDATALAAAQALFPVASDNCDANVTNIVKVMGAFVASATCPQAGTRTNTWTVTDDCGNVSAVFTQVITIIDNTAPVLTGVLPVGQSEINGCIASAPAGPTAAQIAALYTDNCGTVVVTKSGTPTGTNCAWSVTYTYTIADNCGNARPNFVITYSGGDISAPVFTTTTYPNQILNTGAGANCSALMPNYINLLGITATDCGAFTLTQLAPNAPGTMVFGFNGFRNVVIQATDGCGNISTITFVVELKDLTPPTAICKPFTVVLNAAGNGSIVVANVNNGSFDNCTPTSQLVYSLSQTTFNCSNVGTNSVILSVTDLCGNIGTCTAVVTVVDNTAPVISCFGDTTINKDANCTYTMPDLTFRVTKADACGFNANSVTQSIPVGSILGASITSIPVTLTVTDKNGNVSTCTFLITFADVTPPVISGCPANITVNTGLGNTNCSQTATWIPPTAIDACLHLATQTQPITSNFAPGATFPVGVTTVIYTATDAAGNTSTCSFTVTVIDNTRPLIANCPANQVLTTGAGSTICGKAATWTEPTATDNCTAAANLVRTRSHAPGFVFPVGTTTVTYTFADAAGNVSLPCTFTVTVSDNTVPVFTSCPSNIVNPPINTAGCLATVATPNPTFTDNCGVTKLTWALTGVTTASSPATGINYLGTRTFNFGVTTVTYTATDAAGNTATCVYTVSVTRPLTSAIAVNGPATVLQNATTTTTVQFTTRFGTAPYTIVYTAPTGGFPSAGTQSIVTSATNSSTIGADPNWLVTSIPQTNATPGVFTYTLVSVTDAFGCVVTPNTTATVTVVGANYPAPDLTPSFSIGSPIVAPAATKLGYINLNNISPNVTTGAVYFEVYAPSNFNLTIGETTTAIGATSVNNNNFDIVSYPGLGFAITSKPGVMIPAGTNLKIGFNVDAAGGVSNSGDMVIILGNGTGGVATVVGDNNSSNNKGSKTYTISN